MDAPNPYEPPSRTDVLHFTDSTQKATGKQLIYVAWPIAAALNMVVPLLMAWSMTTTRGRVGMGAAVALLLASGWLICWKRREAAVSTVVGAVPLALSQVFPIAQLIAGMIGFELARAIGLNVELHAGSESITSELGGFVVTLATGLLLMLCAAFVGWMLVSVYSIQNGASNGGADPGNG